MSPRPPWTGATYEHTHPQLGALTGRLLPHSYFPDALTVSRPSFSSTTTTDSEIIHFLSIPYALVPRRFSPSVLLDHIPEPTAEPTTPSAADAHAPSSACPDPGISAIRTNYDRAPRNYTTFGPACPQWAPLHNPEWGLAEGGPLDRFDGDDEVHYDEFGCCSVSVCVPRMALPPIFRRSAATGDVRDDAAATDTASSPLLPVMVHIHGMAGRCKKALAPSMRVAIRRAWRTMPPSSASPL
jgi:hypothetical protein